MGNFWVLFWNIFDLACIVHQISSPFCLRFWKMQQRVNGSSDAWWCMVLCPQGASYDPGLLTQFFQQFSKESADSGADLFVRLRLILYSCKIVYMIYLYLIYLGVECFILIMCIILWFLVISSWYGSMAAVLNRRLDFFQNQVHMDVRRDAGHTHCALGRPQLRNCLVTMEIHSHPPSQVDSSSPMFEVHGQI